MANSRTILGAQGRLATLGSGNPTWVNNIVFRASRGQIPQYNSRNIENYLKALHRGKLIIQNIAVVRVKFLPRRICYYVTGLVCC